MEDITNLTGFPVHQGNSGNNMPNILGTVTNMLVIILLVRML
jgi:hypothetical protein